MAEPEAVAEVEVTGAPIPWFEVPGWGERYRVMAGITGRGSAAAPFDLGLAGSEPIGQVLNRWQALSHSFPTGRGTAVARQVHGTVVLWHEDFQGLAVHQGADGHATAKPGLLLCVSAADCIPIYLIDPVRRAIAMLHSGWRGTAAGILASGVRALVKGAGSDPADLVVHCGVGICGACYQVGPEVSKACGVPGAGEVDLRGVIAGQARAAGVGVVTVSPHCTAHMNDRFMSHRRSEGRDGRMVAFLGLLPP